MGFYFNSIVEKQDKVVSRKPRADKKKSVRVWLDDIAYMKILRNSKENELSMTAYCSELVSIELKANSGFQFHEFDYQVEDRVVHIRLTKEDYKEICSLSSLWLYPSIRQTVHRVLMNSLRTEGI
ncbi:hypothetical protein [Metabacillus fastidiosus]|uniref:hypothetical protein n=1 Tax=Metabacillus fastidiosus TaxID=1458 RepID=UPI003D2C7A1F